MPDDYNPRVELDALERTTAGRMRILRRRLSDLYWTARAELEDGWYRLIEHTVCRWRGHRWGEWSHTWEAWEGRGLDFRYCQRCHSPDLRYDEP